MPAVAVDSSPRSEIPKLKDPTTDKKMVAPHTRTLSRDIPELKAYLKPGMLVLDVGSGMGTITLDVAAAVLPGKVVGLDPSATRVKTAQEWQAQQDGGVENASFRVGDSHAIDFPDDTFDVVYSHTVAHFFLEPVTALKEQARVVKPGRWVVVSGVREWVYSVRHPPCPHWTRYMEARDLYSEAQLRAYQSSGLHPAEYVKRRTADNPTHMYYMDPHGGRKLAGWLTDAGLTNVIVSVKAEGLRYHGAIEETMDFLPPADVPAARLQDLRDETALTARKLSADGLLDSSTIELAKKEIEAWYENPHAFFLNLLVFGAGQKPS